MRDLVFDFGTWLLDHKLIFLGSVAALAAAARALLRRQAQVHAARLQRIEQASREITDRELELSAKFLQTLHLSVAERQELAMGRLRLSALVSAARVELARDSFLPSSLRPSDQFAGALLEMRDDTYWVHKRHEIGVGRNSPTVSVEMQSLNAAVHEYLKTYGGSPIDGIVIDIAA